MNKKVTIVGTGAASMYAVLACNDLGIKPALITNDGGLRIQPGAYWLKWLPDSVRKSFESHNIYIDSTGVREVYKSKQWPFHPDNYISSFPTETHIEKGYDPYIVLSDLFSNKERFSLEVTDHLITDSELMLLGRNCDAVFHSFPSDKAKKLNEDSFVKVPIVGRKVLSTTNLVVYDGVSSHDYVRISFLFGNIFEEYPAHVSPKKYVGELFLVNDLKPTKHEPFVPTVAENVLPIGRFGRINRNTLSHNSYELVQNFLREI